MRGGRVGGGGGGDRSYDGDGDYERASISSSPSRPARGRGRGRDEGSFGGDRDRDRDRDRDLDRRGGGGRSDPIRYDSPRADTGQFDWDCAACGASNLARRTACFRCGAGQDETSAVWRWCKIEVRRLTHELERATAFKHVI